MNSPSGASPCCPAQPSPALPSPAQPKRAVILLLALALGLSAAQAHAAFEVRHYFGNSGSHSGDSGGDGGDGTVPGDGEEEASGEQRVVEFTITPEIFRLGQDTSITYAIKVADQNGNHDPSVDTVPVYAEDVYDPGEFHFMGGFPLQDGEALLTQYVPNEELRENFPVEAITATFFASMSETDPGKYATSTLVEGRSVQIDFIDRPDVTHNVIANGEHPYYLVAFISVVEGDADILPDSLKVEWSTTIGNMDVVTTSNNAYNESINFLTSTTAGSGMVTARVLGWGDAEHSIPIEFVSPLSTARVDLLNVTPSPITGEYEEVAEYAISGQVVDADGIPVSHAQVDIHVEYVYPERTTDSYELITHSFEISAAADEDGYFVTLQDIELIHNTTLVVTATVEEGAPDESLTEKVLVDVEDYCQLPHAVWLPHSVCITY